MQEIPRGQTWKFARAGVDKQKLPTMAPIRMTLDVVLPTPSSLQSIGGGTRSEFLISPTLVLKKSCKAFRAETATDFLCLHWEPYHPTGPSVHRQDCYFRNVLWVLETVPNTNENPQFECTWVTPSLRRNQNINCGWSDDIIEPQKSTINDDGLWLHKNIKYICHHEVQRIVPLLLRRLLVPLSLNKPWPMLQWSRMQNSTSSLD